MNEPGDNIDEEDDAYFPTDGEECYMFIPVPKAVRGNGKNDGLTVPVTLLAARRSNHRKVEESYVQCWTQEVRTQ
jgi:hypothetical protein